MTRIELAASVLLYDSKQSAAFGPSLPRAPHVDSSMTTAIELKRHYSSGSCAKNNYDMLTCFVDEIRMRNFVLEYSRIPIIVALQVLRRYIQTKAFWTQRKIIDCHIGKYPHAHPSLELQIISSGKVRWSEANN